MKFLVVIIFVLENVNIFIFTLVYVIYRDVSLSRLRVSFNFVKNSFNDIPLCKYFAKELDPTRVCVARMRKHL